MNKLHWMATGLCLLISLAALYVAFEKTPKTAYVDLAKVYNEFQYKKELENRLLNLNKDTQYLLDSLEARITVGLEEFESKKLQAKEIQNLQAMQVEYTIKKQRIEEDQETMAIDYDEKIWKQLNQYIEDYSQKEGYDYIIGTTGTGTIMGGSEDFDVTDEILDFVNYKYHGGA